MRTLLLTLLLCLSLHAAQAQSPNKYGWVYGSFPTGYGWVVPRVSPTASLTQDVGVTTISLRYARPAVNERVVWGDLVPHDAIWRAGANEATVITFSTDVQVEGHALAAGMYGLFVLPSAQTWTFVFSNRPHQWGAFTFTEDEAVLQVTVTPESAEHQERLQYTIPVVTDSTAQVYLHWERLRAGFTVTVDPAAHAAALANASFDWRAGWFAADYFFNQADRPEEALRWANASIAMQETASTVLLKARILAALMRYDEAAEAARRARTIGSEREQQAADALLEILPGQ